MPNMHAAHGSDIKIYSQVYVLGNKILPFNEKGMSHVRKINKNHISSNIVSKQLVKDWILLSDHVQYKPTMSLCISVYMFVRFVGTDDLRSEV